MTQIKDFISHFIQIMSNLPFNTKAFLGSACTSAVITYAILKWRKRKTSLTRRIQTMKPIPIPKWAVKKNLTRNQYEKTISAEEMDDLSMATLDTRKPSALWNTVITFRGDGSRDPIEQLKYYLREAKTSIYLCIEHCSSIEMNELIFQKYEEGLVVHVITDYGAWSGKRGKNIKSFKFLETKGVPLRVLGVHTGNKKKDYNMNNKFAIIDEEAVLNGTLNWTKQAFQHYSANVLVTTNRGVTGGYLKEFNTLWLKARQV